MPSFARAATGNFVASSRRGSKNVPLPCNLEDRDERVPVRDRAPADPGVQRDARQPERRWQQHRRPLAVGAEALAVERQLGVELARTPRNAQFAAHFRRRGRRIRGFPSSNTAVQYSWTVA
jgi:hypothetical protein